MKTTITKRIAGLFPSRQKVNGRVRAWVLAIVLGGVLYIARDLLKIGDFSILLVIIVIYFMIGENNTRKEAARLGEVIDQLQDQINSLRVDVDEHQWRIERLTVQVEGDPDWLLKVASDSEKEG